MPSFKVPCPSCEHPVLIKDPKLIGTKVECPKCKYRFKVEEPAGGIPTEDAKSNKAKTPVETAEDAAKKKKKSKKLVAIVVGVLAVGLLAIVGIVMMSGGKNKQSAGGGGGGAKGGGSGTYVGSNNANNNAAGGGGDQQEDPNKPTTKTGSGGSSLAFSDKDPTNLLPGQTASLYRFDLEKLRQTPIPIFDKLMLDMFRDSFGFDADLVSVYYHAFVGNTRDPFGVIRLKEPISDKDILAKMALADGSKKVNNRVLYTFKANPFINGIANACSLGSLFSEVYTKVPPGPVTSPESRVIGICIYDTQHILVGDRGRLETYLSQLDAGGTPPALSTVTAPPAGSTLQFAENPLYLSIDPKLKKLLKDLGSESGNPPALLYAERVVPGLYDPTLFKPDFQPIAAVLDPILNRTLYLGANLLAFTPKQLTATVRLEMASDAYALEVVKSTLTPGLMLATSALSAYMGSPVDLRNQAPGGVGVPPTGPAFGPGLTPGMTGPGYGPGMTGPGYGPGSMKPPGSGSLQGPPKPGGPGMGSGSGPPPGMGSGVGPPGMGPGMMPPQGPMGFPPGQMGFPPGSMGPPASGTPSSGPLPNSFVDLGLTDQNITIKIDLHWTDDAYRRLLAPQMFNFVNTIKGKMAVYASDLSYYGLAMAVPKMTSMAKEFPRGTADRRTTDSSRMGFRYPPETRVSFFAELLPFMGRGALSGTIDRQLAWFDERNLPAAEAWVPELLVPTYPQSAWRATSPYVPDGRVMGGTNYVAIAGIGEDAARYNPANPEDAKKVGLIGYDWGSKVSDVKDGLSNTIFLMQTPPGISQPWIAGGGATLRGLNEKDPMLGFRHNYTPNGQPGTYALMGDGSVRFLSGKIDPSVLRAMATRAGGETLDDIIDKDAPRVDQPKKVETELKTDPKPAVPPPVVPMPPVDPKATDPKKSDAPPVPPKTDSPPVPKDPPPGAKLEVAPEPRAKS